MSEAYEVFKFWFPIASAFTLVIKAYLTIKKSVAEWMHTLFTNHLAHIQQATASTVSATQQTNVLLADNTKQVGLVVDETTQTNALLGVMDKRSRA